MEPAEYNKKLSGYLTAGSAAVSIALANETGVLDVLYSSDQPLTSLEIAERGNLKERYVGELLGALVTAEIVQIDVESVHYHIPASHRESLKPVAAYCRLITHFGEKFSAIKNCFEKDRPAGVRYFDFPSIFDIMYEGGITEQNSIIDGEILPVVPGLKESLETGIDVAEFACATGILTNNLAGRFPKSRFLGSDVVDENVRSKARKIAAERNLSNIRFQAQDLFELPESYSNAFDWVFIRETIHDLPDPVKTLREIHRVLKPGGTFSMLECGMEGKLADNVGDLGTSFLFLGSIFLCVPESYQRTESLALGAAWNFEKAREMIKEAGFTLVKESLQRGVYQAAHFVCKK